MKVTSHSNISKTYLKEYKACDFKVKSIDLDFQLDPQLTRVRAFLDIKKISQGTKDLFLDGEDLKLTSLKFNDQTIEASDYEVTPKGLWIRNIQEDSFKITTEVEISPEKNLALEGLYLSGGILCTQNEPEGFRRITYFIDRPDNMSSYSVKLTADKDKYPVLLANGNCVEKGELDHNLHWTLWKDPFPKPCYLFALVAGRLGKIEDQFKTRSGHFIDLSIYCDLGYESQCHFAMESLKKAMKWDEDRFDLEYDLDQYMIVAVGSFNSGAMENKGLNIFNSALVLADQKTTTDNEYLNIEGVIGHEYFHNWTGNRVTCRDWFQLTLKEGLTVFRDQEFSADLNSRAVKRIKDVRRLQEVQFSEDASPMAHPIRPESYVQINNFYTATVYEKGAEVIRMIHTLVGEEGFQKGMKKYFELFDHQAVTTEDFIFSMKSTNPHFDDVLFQNWYIQSGTPCVKFNGSYNEKEKTYILSYTQENSGVQESNNNRRALFIPIKIGFIDKFGNEFKPQLQQEGQDYWDQNVLALKKHSEDIQFKEVPSRPVLSINRSLSAPVKVEMEITEEDQIHLLKNDTDSLNKYHVSQKIMSQWILDHLEESTASISSKVTKAFSEVLRDSKIDAATKALIFSVPTESVLHQSQNPIDFERTVKSRENLSYQWAQALESQFLEIYESLNQSTQGEFESEKVGPRSLKNLALGYLARMGGRYKNLVVDHYKLADNMTDRFYGILYINRFFPDLASSVNKEFYRQWQTNDLVLQKWITVQFQSLNPKHIFKTVNQIKAIPEYKNEIPNYVRALWGSFARHFISFHHSSGQGYKIMSDQIIELDSINRSMAAMMTKSFRIKPSINTSLKKLIDENLRKILAKKNISSHVAEVASQILES